MYYINNNNNINNYIKSIILDTDRNKINPSSVIVPIPIVIILILVIIIFLVLNSNIMCTSTNSKHDGVGTNSFITIFSPTITYTSGSTVTHEHISIFHMSNNVTLVREDNQHREDKKLWIVL